MQKKIILLLLVSLSQLHATKKRSTLFGVNNVYMRFRRHELLLHMVKNMPRTYSFYDELNIYLPKIQKHFEFRFPALKKI